MIVKARTEAVSMKAVRRNCLECSGDSVRHVTWCPCNGHTSTDCEFWASRFGVRPETFISKNGPFLLTPEIMPASSVNIEELPSTVAGASKWLRERHPKIEWKGPREKTPEEVERGKRRMARARAALGGGREIDSKADFPVPALADSTRKPR